MVGIMYNKEARARYYRNHPDRCREASKKWVVKKHGSSAEYQRKQRLANPAKFRQYDRKKYLSTPPEKLRAREKLKYAIRKGEVIRPSACSRCRRECKPDAHHQDYSKPFVVLWLCRICHCEEHKQLKLRA